MKIKEKKNNYGNKIMNKIVKKIRYLVITLRAFTSFCQLTVSHSLLRAAADREEFAIIVANLH